MTIFDWISVDDPRKPDVPEGDEFSEDVLLCCCDEDGYWHEIGCYCSSGFFVRHEDPVSCKIRYWAPLLLPPFPAKRKIAKDLAAIKRCLKQDREECRRRRKNKESRL